MYLACDGVPISDETFQALLKDYKDECVSEVRLSQGSDTPPPASSNTSDTLLQAFKGLSSISGYI